ncbi:MAG: prepilin-type N-terminal cleavage/methylation domain-containing protein, partial [Myxococcota bacterium]
MMSHRSIASRAARQGFTLLEMIVAIAIASFVVAGLYGLFTIQSRQFMFQDLQMEMHQNLRFGTDVLSRSIRMAGFNTNGTINGLMGSDGTSGTSVDSSTLQAIVPWDSDGSNNTDAITVVYGDPTTTMNTDYSTLEGCSTTTISFQANRGDNQTKLQQFDTGDLLLCYDFAATGSTEAYLWDITGVDAAGGKVSVTDLNGGSYNDYDSVCPTTENLSPIMRCAKGQVLTFYIDDTDDGTGPGTEDHPVLMMDMNFNWPNDDDVPLVDNIEDLQFEYCLDSELGTTDCDTPEQWKDDFTTN